MTKYSGMGADRKRVRATQRRVASRGVYRTERLRLVPIDARHAPELWELHQDEGIARWHPLSREQALRFAERMESSWRRGVGKWLAYEESTGAFVGRGGPSWSVVESTECVEIGWALCQEVWGRGYATEIGRAGLDHAFSVLGGVGRAAMNGTACVSTPRSGAGVKRRSQTSEVKDLSSRGGSHSWGRRACSGGRTSPYRRSRSPHPRVAIPRWSAPAVSAAHPST